MLDPKAGTSGTYYMPFTGQKGTDGIYRNLSVPAHYEDGAAWQINDGEMTYSMGVSQGAARYAKIESGAQVLKKEYNPMFTYKDGLEAVDNVSFVAVTNSKSSYNIILSKDTGPMEAYSGFEDAYIVLVKHPASIALAVEVSDQEQNTGSYKITTSKATIVEEGTWTAVNKPVYQQL